VAKKEKGGEYEHHVVGVRLRVNGAGNMKLSLTDLDDIQTQNLVDMPMQLTTRFEPLRLANFQSQRIRLVGKTTAINEHFEIQRIIIFAKPVALEYPA
jgi:hypothetical protein